MIVFGIQLRGSLDEWLGAVGEGGLWLNINHSDPLANLIDQCSDSHDQATRGQVK